MGWGLGATDEVVELSMLFWIHVHLSLLFKYQEDAAELKDMSKYKPHILLSQENTQIRDLQQENRGEPSTNAIIGFN